jgi:hypothetical protein
MNKQPLSELDIQIEKIANISKKILKDIEAFKQSMRETQSVLREEIKRIAEGSK